MNFTGTVRKIDMLGRFVLPAGLRRNLEIGQYDDVEIYLDKGQIVVQKYEPACVICGADDGVSLFKGKSVCVSCVSELNN